MRTQRDASAEPVPGDCRRGDGSQLGCLSGKRLGLHGDPVDSAETVESECCESKTPATFRCRAQFSVSHFANMAIEGGTQEPIFRSPASPQRGHIVCTTTDMSPVLRRLAGFTLTSMSWPSTLRNSNKRPTDTETGLQRMSAETCAWVVPSSLAASVCVTPKPRG